MTTLESIGITLGFGMAVCLVAEGAFGVAVKKRSTFIAPRATARPRNVIYNPHPQHSSQDRGNPWTGWIPWTLSLTYDTFLEGVPGTGTREGGLSGSFLKATMDGIVLLRFHSIGLKISALATVLFLLILLPSYYSAQCYGLTEEEQRELPGCAAVEQNFTNYEKLTIANVPNLADAEDYTTLENPGRAGILVRLYAAVFCFWIVIGYTMWLLRKEWTEILAMRRVYYLEFDVWKERREELKATLMYEANARRRQKDRKHFTFEEMEKLKGSNAMSGADADEEYLVKRDPWIPHPEQRDTVPNVSLYSLLVGGLPSLPEQAAEAFDTEATINYSKRDSIDWQLSVAATFFDHCVPNQPGFSSSVAAVTILPSPRCISQAWSKWYAAASKLRRLRFIREQIAERRHYDIQLVDQESDVEDDVESRGDPSVEVERIASDEVSEVADTPSFYNDLAKNEQYYRSVIGSMTHDDVENEFMEAFCFGPEQAAVYSREFAQAAAPCCPRGCHEERVRRARIDDLLEMEKEAEAEVHQANVELHEARQRAIVVDQRRTSPPDHAPQTNGRSEDAAAAATTAGSPPRKNDPFALSLGPAQLPNDLDLEADLFTKQKTHKRVGSAVSATSQEAKEPASAVSLHSGQMPSGHDASDHDLDAELSEKDEAHTRLERDTLPASASQDALAPASMDVETGELLPTAFSSENGPSVNPTRWEVVESIMSERDSERSKKRSHLLASGKWQMPSIQSLLGRTKNQVDGVTKWAKDSSKDAVDVLARDSTYAVVTFTSRQAAVAGRHCIADARGTGRWANLKDIPIPPLADASACSDFCACRNCCRPVTLSINDRQKNFRNHVAIILLALIYIFYTVPLTFASSLVSPEKLDQLFPRAAEWSESLSFDVLGRISGLLTAAIWSTFFALCPVMFKAIANFGSKATSVSSAEYKALQYYWWFMVLTAFAGQLLAQMFLQGLNDGLSLTASLRSILRQVANTIPTTIAASWLNWIIFRWTITLPLNYLLQVNTFIFAALRMPCCSRVVRGGGPGGPTPYRIFVDSGVVLMCVMALAPASPLLAPAAFVYFLVCQPLLRRNLIFMYRPKFDGGGLRWPFVFDMCISGMIVGEILLTVQMVLKAAIGPAIIALLSIPPTVMFQNACRHQFLREYNDAALLQTSLLDGWNTAEPSSMKQREEYRQFLVDAHKAAYIPVCVASAEADEFMTAEPAVVVPVENDLDFVSDDMASIPEDSPSRPRTGSSPSSSGARKSGQHGATFRRAVNMVTSLNSLKNRARNSSSGSDLLRSIKEADGGLVSPFQRGLTHRIVSNEQKKE